jgi:alanine racemase
VEDVSNHTFAERQLALFAKARTVFADEGFALSAHCAASASALLLPESHLDMVRLGISLYGLWPSALTKLSSCADRQHSPSSLKPVLSWRTRISMIHHIERGEFVGYGCTFKASHPMELALLPVGYFEGYPRLAGNHGGSHVLIKGQRCPLLGRISMNMMVVDVSGISGVEVGTIATLVGSDGPEQVSAEDLAGWAQTISYEVMARINPALPRQIR